MPSSIWTLCFGERGKSFGVLGILAMISAAVYNFKILSLDPIVPRSLTARGAPLTLVTLRLPFESMSRNDDYKSNKLRPAHYYFYTFP